MFTKMFKITKQPRKFPAGEYTGYGFKLSSSYTDYKTKEKNWTNYELVVFSKSANQIAFYDTALVIGTVIEVVAENLSVESFLATSGVTYNSIKLVEAKITNIVTMGDAQPQQGAQQGAQQGEQQGEPYGYSVGEPPVLEGDLPF